MASLSDEEENYIRMGLLLTGITPRAVRSLFDAEFAPAVLQSTLKKEYNTLLALFQRRIINQAQWSILSSNPDSKTFDISLMICLLTNITSIPGYNRHPSKTDTSKGADLARIKHYRNYHAHLNDSKVDNSYFVAAWNDMSDMLDNAGITSIADSGRYWIIFIWWYQQNTYWKVLGRLGGISIRQECTDLRTKVLDRSNQEIFREIKISQDEIYILKQELGDVKKKLNTIDKMRKDVIPPPLKGLIKDKLESWLEEDNTFVTTRAADRILASIQTNSFVIVTGNSGVGKTYSTRHAALQLQKQGYILIPTSKPEDIVNVYNKVPKTVFVVDDLCGHYTLNQQYFDNFKQTLGDLKMLLKTDCKIIATCRLQVFKDERFKQISALNYIECNLNCKDLCLTEQEKGNLANTYFLKDVKKKDRFFEIYNKFDCFPLLCKLLSTDETMTFASLSKNPFDCFENEFDDFLYGGQMTGQYKYCALCLVALFNNELDEKYLTNDKNAKQKMIKDTLSKCKLNEGTSLENIKDALDTLNGSLVVKNKNVYSTIHDKIFDFVAYYFGQKMLNLFIKHCDTEFIRERFLCKVYAVGEDNAEFTIMIPDDMLNVYLKRLTDDWLQRHVNDVFGNRNMKNKHFRETILNYVTKLKRTNQLLLAGMIDGNSGDTSLILSCRRGYLEILNRLIECKADVNKCQEDGASPVYIACQEGHLEILNRLIECEADVNKCMEDGASPIYIACQKGYLEILVRLIECKADVNKCKENGLSPVWIACSTGHLEILNRLIECKADVNKCKENGLSPVWIACFIGHLKILNRLIECKADVNKCNENDGVSPVYIACQRGHLQILDRLLECKADVNKCNENGVSPVYIACQRGHLQILNRLLECKADVNKCRENGVSPVYIACKEGHLDILKRLIECKADVNKCKENGESPVYIACQEGHLDILNRLIECEADVNTCLENGKSPVYITCEKGNLDILNRLIECEADVNKCQENGKSPVYIACEEGHLEILNILIECKADVNKCQENGVSPVYIACEYGYLHILNRLIECEADINKCQIECKADINKCQENGKSPVYIACKEGHLHILNRLIECKADINKCQENGKSPVYIACEYDDLEILNRLTECEADINKCRDDGTSPVYIACEYGHLEILNRLIECGADINKCRDDGTSPVYITCQKGGNLDILKRLLECKADVNKCCENGISPVFLSCFNGNLHFLSTLIEYNADVNMCDTNGISPIYITCEGGHLDLCNRLLESNADMQDFTSLVDVALKNDNLLIAERLLQLQEETEND